MDDLAEEFDTQNTLLTSYSIEATLKEEELRNAHDELEDLLKIRDDDVLRIQTLEADVTLLQQKCKELKKNHLEHVESLTRRSEATKKEMEEEIQHCKNAVDDSDQEKQQIWAAWKDAEDRHVAKIRYVLDHVGNFFHHLSSEVM